MAGQCWPGPEAPAADWPGWSKSFDSAYLFWSDCSCWTPPRYSRPRRTFSELKTCSFLFDCSFCWVTWRSGGAASRSCGQHWAGPAPQPHLNSPLWSAGLILAIDRTLQFCLGSFSVLTFGQICTSRSRMMCQNPTTHTDFVFLTLQSSAFLSIFWFLARSCPRPRPQVPALVSDPTYFDCSYSLAHSAEWSDCSWSDFAPVPDWLTMAASGWSSSGSVARWVVSHPGRG